MVCMFLSLQHANEDVEKMILGNKCDIDGKRAVNKDRGEAVSIDLNVNFILYLLFTVPSAMNESD